MQEQSVPVRAWLRRNLAERYGSIVREEIPSEMLTLIDTSPRQD